jgi:hypothetical protein
MLRQADRQITPVAPVPDAGLALLAVGVRPRFSLSLHLLKFLIATW